MIKNKPVIAIIGGSGLYNLENINIDKLLTVSTPFGNTSDKIDYHFTKNERQPGD